MENFKPIDFHQARDFSQKLNATFGFIRQNFKSLGKSILLIAGPPVLIASLIIGSFISEVMNLAQAVGGGSNEGVENYFMSVSFWLQILLVIVFLTISAVMNLSTINNYVLLYGEKQTNKIDVAEVWERVRNTFWMYFSTMFLFMVLLIAAYIVLLIPVGILGSISPFLIFFGMIFFFCGIMYLIFGASLTFFIRAYEKKGFFEAVFRSYKLVRDKWWSTFGLLIILYLVMMTISYLFLMPWYIVTMVSAFHSTTTDTLQEPTITWQVMTIVIFALYYLAQMVLASLPNVGIAFQYFNLVELKEAKGLMDRIDTIGQTPAPLTEPNEGF